MKHGTELGVDLYELWCAGTKDLPAMAGAIGAAAAKLNATAVKGAFTRTGDLGTSATGAYPLWESVADALDGYLARMRTSLDDAGAALVLTQREYVARDAEAKAKFDDLKSKDVTQFRQELKVDR